MGRVIKVDLSKVHAHKGELSLPLPPAQPGMRRSIHVWLSSPTPVVVSVASQEIVLPLHVGEKLDQTYEVDETVEALIIAPDDDELVFGYSIKLNGTRAGSVVDPTPTKAIVPLDDNSLQMRVMRAVQAQLERAGIRTAEGRGKRYEDHEDENEFGTGYEYDEDLDEALAYVRDKRARNAAADRMQRSNPPGTSGEHVPDDNPSDDHEDGSDDGEEYTPPAGGRKPDSDRQPRPKRP